MQLTKIEPSYKTTVTFYPVKRAALGKMIISQTERLQILEVHNTTTNALINKESKLTTPQRQQDLAEYLTEHGFKNDPTTRPAQYYV